MTLKDLSAAINASVETNSDRYVKCLGMVRARATAFGIAIHQSVAPGGRVRLTCVEQNSNRVFKGSK